MTRDHQSLVVLIALRNSIERAVLCLYSASESGLAGRADRLSDPNLCFILQNHIQILLSSFLEEWPRFASRAKDDLEVRETLRQVQPATARLMDWKDLPSVRSKLLAHPFRDKQGNIVFPWGVFRQSSAPTTLAETLLLGFCVLMTVDRIKARHAREVADGEHGLMQTDRSVPEKGIKTLTELEVEFARLKAALAATSD